MNERRFLETLSKYRHDVVAAVPKLKRGQVWCYQCGRTEHVDSTDCLVRGWPKCCGSTMGIDSPEERQKLAQATPGQD